MTRASQFEHLVDAVSRTGFVVRGAFHAVESDEVPPDVSTVVMLGTVGQAGYAAFRESPEWGSEPNPMDRHAERVIGALADEIRAQVVYPHHGPPWWPFQRWATRAERVFASPLQILIHPQHGLWHSWRAALLFREPLQGVPDRDAARADVGDSPCQRCAAKPCLSACPVDAFVGGRFDRARCLQHLRSDAGRTCMQNGCAARNACPVAPHARYSPEQHRFHMRAFVR